MAGCVMTLLLGFLVVRRWGTGMEAEKICPFCQEHNRCGSHEGARCWCATEEIPQALKSLVPAPLRMKACICQRCVRSYKADAKAFRQAYAPPIHYRSDRLLSPETFVDLLRRSTLAERRPVEDLDIIQAMLAHANLLCTAWDGDLLVGVARSLTDFEFCCYLSDLAVDEAYQHRGIGTGLVALTQARLGPKAKIILLAAPKARDYYPKLGFEAHPSAWLLPSRTQGPS